MGRTVHNLNNKEYKAFLGNEIKKYDVSSTDKAIASYLLYLESVRQDNVERGFCENDYIYVSSSKIREKLNIGSLPTVYSSIRKLEQIGLISNVERAHNGKGECNKYYINREFLPKVQEEPKSYDDIDVLLQEIETLKAQNEELKEQNNHIIWMLNQLMPHRQSKMEKVY